MSQRQAKRYLVRWNDELHNRLLLCIQYACNEKGVKLPWDAISKALDPNVTEGAILQHLSKMRTRMANEGIEVPPPLRRGGIAVGGPSNYTPQRTPKTPKTAATKHRGGGGGTAIADNAHPEATHGTTELVKTESDDDNWSPVPRKRGRTVNRARISNKNKANADSNGAETDEPTHENKSGDPFVTTSDRATCQPVGESLPTPGEGRKIIPTGSMKRKTKTPNKPVPKPKVLSFGAFEDEESSASGEQAPVSASSGLVKLRLPKGYCSEKFPRGLAHWPSSPGNEQVKNCGEMSNVSGHEVQGYQHLNREERDEEVHSGPGHHAGHRQWTAINSGPSADLYERSTSADQSRCDGGPDQDSEASSEHDSRQNLLSGHHGQTYEASNYHGITADRYPHGVMPQRAGTTNESDRNDFHTSMMDMNDASQAPDFANLQGFGSSNTHGMGPRNIPGVSSNSQRQDVAPMSLLSMDDGFGNLLGDLHDSFDGALHSTLFGGQQRVESQSQSLDSASNQLNLDNQAGHATTLQSGVTDLTGLTEVDILQMQFAVQPPSQSFEELIHGNGEDLFHHFNLE